ncbi:ATP-binding cassette domain-containing protein [Streptomyces aurantiacus]|uniref:Putative Bacitracin transport ATP-binding protein BcrA n=1 Tax=Streptomyces aurantiacus JA 4570 TaxID=1286094 RepID=S3ZL77_9ACTN|nr:ATP-binding cassette domain-containing protein [Streptomyces aurantiacus]EPH43534.1 putative Bacitracin transport ATP-binding protein BcrA [Streptomyces aurantiacus JA 4570]
MIEATELTKRYGDKTAVDRLSFTVRPGRVTGFLGPNGAGKSTTMRLILGLDAPSSGRVTVGGRRYADLAAPLRAVGSLLDAKGVHGGRSAYQHLAGLAASNNVPRRRVDEVLDLVGLPPATARRRAKGFSLGMGQRLGIAAALIGDPEVLILDEPVNGLDTEGIRWIRDLVKSLAADGRTVFLSSHLMSEMELTADHLIVIGRGRLIADTTVRDFIASNSRAHTLVRSPEPERLRTLLEAKGAVVTLAATGALRVEGPDAAAIGDLAHDHGLAIHELAHARSSLEEVYTALSQDATEYRAAPQHPEEALR